MMKIKITNRMTFHYISIGIIAVVFVAIVVLGLTDFNLVSANNQRVNLPKYGWVVCEDFGIGFVQGFGNVHRFRLCNQEVWQLLAFCLDPGKPVPSVGTICELIDSQTFWCGDKVQRLRIYEIKATSTPIPTATFTPTSTPTSTATFTATATQTITPSFTPTFTSTMTPTFTQTITLTFTPSLTLTFTPTSTPHFTTTATTTLTPTIPIVMTPTTTSTLSKTSTPHITTTDVVPTQITITPTKRERLGGSENFGKTEINGLLIGSLVIGIGIITALVDWEKLAK